jgi:hypothetical protein
MLFYTHTVYTWKHDMATIRIKSSDQAENSYFL